MRKFFMLGCAGLAVLALAISPVFAGEQCTKAGDSKACAKICGAAKGTSASADKAGCAADAKMIKADGMPMSKEECAKMAAEGKCTYMSKEECAKLCADGSKCEVVNMSIKGMTCTGCEQTITTALQKIDGVKKVVSISYKDGSAVVVIDPAKVKSDVLATAVVDKGYEAKVIPAVATATEAVAKGHACSPENKAACAAKGEKTGIEGTK